MTTEENTQKTEEENISLTKKIPQWASIILNIIIVLGVLFFVRAFIFLPFNVDGPSMEPTLHHKEFIYVDKLFPRFFDYDHGDIIVFYPPSQDGEIKEVQETGLICMLDTIKNIIFFQGKEDPCTVPASFVKRVIGVPGDKVEVQNGNVYVTPQDGERTMVSEDFLLEENLKKTCAPASKCSRRFQLVSEGGKDFGIVPEDTYFVLGDNRINSSDSRAENWDTPFVPIEQITGTVRAVYLSPAQIAAQDSLVKTYWEAIKAIPQSFSGVRWIGDDNILGE